MNYDDETLMAYADGELDEAQSAAIAAAVEKDPVLARRVERHRALRAEVADAYATIVDQPVPERLVAAAGGGSVMPGRNPPQRRADVLSFPARVTPPRAGRWQVREWAAMAASLVLGLLVSWKMFAPAEPVFMTAQGGRLIAEGPLAVALEQQLASSQGNEPVLIGLTFRSRDGEYCRTFAVIAAGTSGLACRSEGQWRIPVTATLGAGADVMRQAHSPPREVLQAVEGRIAGGALDAAAEKDARDRGWQPEAAQN